MKDLKLFTKNGLQLQGLLVIVKQSNDDIRIEFSIDKCAKTTFDRYKSIEKPNVKL